MQSHLLVACAILALAAGCVAGYKLVQKKRALDEKKRRRTLQNLRMALDE